MNRYSYRCLLSEFSYHISSIKKHISQLSTRFVRNFASFSETAAVTSVQRTAATSQLGWSFVTETINCPESLNAQWKAFLWHHTWHNLINACQCLILCETNRSLGSLQATALEVLKRRLCFSSCLWNTFMIMKPQFHQTRLTAESDLSSSCRLIDAGGSQGNPLRVRSAMGVCVCVCALSVCVCALSVCVGMKVVTHKSEREGESESCDFCPQLW